MQIEFERRSGFSRKCSRRQGRRCFCLWLAVGCDEYRAALKVLDLHRAEQVRNTLEASELRRYLDNVLAGGRDTPRQFGSRGFIYILSTRSQPRYLKLGMTQRTVEIRVKEINAATRVLVPFGVRAVGK
jgi:hypothetical protein